MARIQYNRDRGNYLEVYDCDSLTDMNETLYQHCADTMGANPPYIGVEYPVYLRDIYSVQEPGKLTRIGYVSLVYENDADGYVAHHYTLDRKELPDEWSAVRFYGGEYGFKTEEK
ncbi:hypothetical protein EAT47_07215 [Salmonella enterica]|nr:hypothetical protein [Salmonella enterica]EBI4121226.1 hypothetical protein [Salmonella enterica]EBN1261844.1 hypothetical protein [Salmonella enterica]EBQ6502478.1 hypothetical protein [Salmonella enterica]EBR6231789.1 hypothetical protein [Salmonella enterica]